VIHFGLLGVPGDFTRVHIRTTFITGNQRAAAVRFLPFLDYTTAEHTAVSNHYLSLIQCSGPEQQLKLALAEQVRFSVTPTQDTTP
jgi:hypothetical protein